MTDPSSTVAVVGGGITGLAAAHRVLELSAERGLATHVFVFEETERLGGKIRTEHAEGLVLEAGPDQFVRAKPAAVLLCRRLSLGDQLVDLDAGPAALQVLHRGRPVALPDGLGVLGPSRLAALWRSDLLSTRGKLRVALERFVPRRRGPLCDESLGSFVRRRFGREFLDRVAEPVLAGIYTADAEAMGLAVALPRLLELERVHGSVSAALGRARPLAPHAEMGFVALAPGMQCLIDALIARLPAGCVSTSAAVERLARDARTGGLRLFVAGRGFVPADAVILACPSAAAARLAGGCDGELGRRLGALQYASCATVHLAYRASAVGRPLLGFGFFAGRSAELPILACSYVSRKFPERAGPQQVLLRAFLGGARDSRRLSADDGSLVEAAHTALAGVLDIRETPRFSRVHRYPDSMPQYPVGHRSCLEAIDERLVRCPGLFVAGGVTGAVGLPDCIASGEAAARSALDFAWTAALAGGRSTLIGSNSPSGSRS